MSGRTLKVLDLLSAALKHEEPGLCSDLDALSDVLLVAVPSFLGFNVHTSELSFSWGPGMPSRPGDAILAASTMRWDLAETTPAPVKLVLFATRRGAWVDLCADLAWLTGCPPQRFVLDDDLAATVPVEQTELLESSTINQAIGALVSRGYPVEEAGDELDARARAANTSCFTAAATLLDDLTGRPPRPAAIDH